MAPNGRFYHVGERPGALLGGWWHILSRWGPKRARPTCGGIYRGQGECSCMPAGTNRAYGSVGAAVSSTLSFSRAGLSRELAPWGRLRQLPAPALCGFFKNPQNFRRKNFGPKMIQTGDYFPTFWSPFFTRPKMTPPSTLSFLLPRDPSSAAGRGMQGAPLGPVQ